MPTRSGAAGASSSGRRHQSRTATATQRDRHEERAVAEQRGETVAERPADRAGQVGGEGRGRRAGRGRGRRARARRCRARGAGSGRRRGPATGAAPGGPTAFLAGGLARRASLGFADGRDLDPRGTSWWPRNHRNTGNIHHIGILLPHPTPLPCDLGGQSLPKRPEVVRSGDVRRPGRGGDADGSGDGLDEEVVALVDAHAGGLVEAEQAGSSSASSETTTRIWPRSRSAANAARTSAGPMPLPA